MLQLIQFTKKFYCHPYFFLRKCFFIGVFTSIIVKISLSQVTIGIFTGKFAGIFTGTLGPINFIYTFTIYMTLLYMYLIICTENTVFVFKYSCEYSQLRISLLHLSNSFGTFISRCLGFFAVLGYYFFSENNTAVYQSVKKQFKSRLIFNFHVDFGIIYLKNRIEFRCNFFRIVFFYDMIIHTKFEICMSVPLMKKEFIFSLI